MCMQAHVSRASFAHPTRNANQFGIEPGMTVADFGAGSGHYTFAIAQMLQGSGRVYAIDVQRDLVRRIKNEAIVRNVSNVVEAVAGDIEKPHGSRLADQSIDVVLVSNTLFALEDPVACLREAHRVLKPSGHLVLIDWSGSFNHMGPHPKHVISEDKAVEIARQARFAFLDTFEAGAHHWGLVLKPVAHKAI